MTEAEWLACEDIGAMFRAVRARSKRRLSRLFAVACCRAIQPQLPDARSQFAIETAERHADGLATDEELASALQSAHEVVAARSTDPTVIEAAVEVTAALQRKEAALAQWEYRNGLERAAECVAMPHPFNAAEHVSRLVCSHLWHPLGLQRSEQARILRDIFTDILCPVAFDPAWRTDTAVSLARGMYDSREFGAMPILADALQDAGCEDEQVLNHCREPGPHVRGCWVCDLVLSLG